jgi:hypothetical protein
MKTLMTIVILLATLPFGVAQTQNLFHSDFCALNSDF